MTVIANLMIRLGWSRDDLKWPLAQLVTVAGLITSNVINVPYWFGYLGIPISELNVHRLMVAAIIILWVAGKYNSSPLPSGAAMASGAVPDSPASKKG